MRLFIHAAAHAALPIDAELAYTYDDNVTRAQRDSDIFDDRFLSLQVGTSYLYWLNQKQDVEVDVRSHSSGREYAHAAYIEADEVVDFFRE